MRDRDLVLGVDVGTTATKAALFDPDGNLVAGAARGYRISRPAPGIAEQEPGDWWQALEGCLAEIAPAADLARVAGIGVVSQVNTHVFVGDDGEAVRPAVTWQDTRPAGVAAEIDAGLDAAAKERLWGGPFPVDASFAVSRAAWLRQTRPDEWARTRWILSPKDEINRRLCGRVGSDPVSSIGLTGPDGGYIAGVLGLVPDLGPRLAPLRAMTAPLGSLPAPVLGLPAGAVVVTGTMDAWGNLYGSGLVDAGQAMHVAGTSEILGVLSATATPTAGVVSFHPVDGLTLHAGPTQAGGAALAWIANALGLGIAEALTAAEGVPAGSGELIFCPHLAGERAPLWDADARGVFVGLAADHGPGHLVRAVLEGVAYSARHLLEAIDEAAGFAATELRLSGGASRSGLWNAVKADVLGRPLAVLRVRDTGVLGAALMAMVGAGLRPSLRDAARNAVHVERVVDPDRGNGPAYEERYRIYRGLYPALGESFRALAARRLAATAPGATPNHHPPSG